MADLDLSDGVHTYYNQQLDRSACEQACGDLDHPEKLRAWHRLANQPALSAFLALGQNHFLLSPPTNIRSLANDRELVMLIGPRYARQFDRALLGAFEEDDLPLLEALSQAPALYTPSQASQAVRSVSRLIRQQIGEIEELTHQLDEDDNEYAADTALNDPLSGCYHSSNLNALPDEQFRGLRSDFAMAVRNYAVKLFNTFFDTESATQLLQRVTGLDTDNQTADRITQDLEQIEEIAKQNRIREEQEARGQRFGKVFEQLVAYQKQLESGTVAVTTLQQWSTGLAPIIRELNASRDQDLVMIRDAFALGLRGLSVEIWNKKSDGRAALAILEVGLTIDCSAETKGKLQSDKQQLTRLTTQLAAVRSAAPSRPAYSSSSKSSSSGLPGWVWVVGILAVIFFVLKISGGSSSSNSDSSTSSSYPTTDPSTSATTSSGPSTMSGLPEQLPRYTEYKGNQLKNGASPLDNCFGKGRYSGPAWIVFRNGNSDTDAIVCLARMKDDKIIRNEYIKAGSDFKMSSIPAGSYYLKVFYGRDWNPKRRNACGTRGVFDTDEHFSVSRDPSDLIDVSVSSRSYTTGEITLYTVAGGNMAQQSVSEGEFFRQ